MKKLPFRLCVLLLFIFSSPVPVLAVRVVPSDGEVREEGFFREGWRQAKKIAEKTLRWKFSNLPCPREEEEIIISQCGLSWKKDTDAEKRQGCDQYRRLEEQIKKKEDISVVSYKRWNANTNGSSYKKAQEERIAQIGILQELGYHQQVLDKVRSYKTIYSNIPSPNNKILEQKFTFSIKELKAEMTDFIENGKYCEAALLIEPFSSETKLNDSEAEKEALNSMRSNLDYLNLYKLRIKAFNIGEHHNETRDEARAFVHHYGALEGKNSCYADEIKYLIAKTYLDELLENDAVTYYDTLVAEKGYQHFLDLARSIKNDNGSICSNEFRDLDTIKNNFMTAYDWLVQKQLDVAKYQLKVDKRIEVPILSGIQDKLTPIFKKIRGQEIEDYNERYAIACVGVSLRLAEVLNDFPDTKHIEETIYYQIAAYQKLQHKQLEAARNYLFSNYPESNWTKKLKAFDTKGKNILSDKLQCVNVLNGERKRNEDGSLGKLRVEYERENEKNWQIVEMTNESLSFFFRNFYEKIILPNSIKINCEEKAGIMHCNEDFYANYEKLYVHIHEDKPWAMFHVVFESKKSSELHIGIQEENERMSVVFIPGQTGYINGFSWKREGFSFQIKNTNGELERKSCTVNKGTYSSTLDCYENFYKARSQEEEAEDICELIDCTKFYPDQGSNGGNALYLSNQE